LRVSKVDMLYDMASLLLAWSPDWNMSLFLRSLAPICLLETNKRFCPRSN
jgi:hypothetical protein